MLDAELLSIDDRNVLSSSKVWYFPMRFFGAKEPDGYCPTAFRFVNAGCNRAAFEAVPQQHVGMLTPPAGRNPNTFASYGTALLGWY
jgi:hypothetical protein